MGSPNAPSRDGEALDELVPLLYQELRQAARRQLAARAGDRDGTPTLATTALVGEVYLKLAEQSHARWQDREHFLAVAAVAMRHILVDRARARVAIKRGGHTRAVPLDDEMAILDGDADLVLEIDDALRSIEALNPRLARLVELRFFAGLSEEEAARSLGVTVRTAQRDWAKARVLLHHQLGR